MTLSTDLDIADICASEALAINAPRALSRLADPGPTIHTLHGKPTLTRSLTTILTVTVINFTAGEDQKLDGNRRIGGEGGSGPPDARSSGQRQGDCDSTHVKMGRREKKPIPVLLLIPRYQQRIHMLLLLLLVPTSKSSSSSTASVHTYMGVHGCMLAPLRPLAGGE